MSRCSQRISIAFGVYSAILMVAFAGFLLFNRAYIPELTFGFFDELISVLFFSFLGVLLTYQRPENLISWLIVVVALLRQTSFFHIVVNVLFAKGIEPTISLLFIGNLWPWLSALTYTIFAYVIVLFPRGRLPSSRWRPATWLLALQTALTASLILFMTYHLVRFFPSALEQETAIMLTSAAPNFPFALALHFRPVPELAIFAIVLALVALTMVLLGFWSQISQYRHGDGVVRQQIKWVIFAVVIWAVILLLVFVVPVDVPATALSIISPLLPLAIAIPILRYRLYDLDLIIRRTLVYGALTVLLAVIYLGIVILLQSLVSAVSGQESPLIIVISTLVIAALFAPLRRRVQRFIDRRFYRRKYDATQTLAQFAATARDEVDLNQLTAELAKVVEETMRPESLSIWLKDR